MAANRLLYLGMKMIRKKKIKDKEAIFLFFNIILMLKTNLYTKFFILTLFLIQEKQRHQVAGLYRVDLGENRGVPPHFHP